MDINIYPKQEIALKALMTFPDSDLHKVKTVKEIVYGGAAGGGKSHLGCLWLILSCLKYPGSKWLLGRNMLSKLKTSTMETFTRRVAADLGLRKFVEGMKAGEWDYKYHGQSSRVDFANGSVIDLRALKLNPSDPDADMLGGAEYSGAWVDEASELHPRVKEVILSRLRWKLFDTLGGFPDLYPKLLLTCNPAKNFLYHDFYLPWKKNELPEDKMFVQALVRDNLAQSDTYVTMLSKLEGVSRERLYEGSWEYDSDPTTLCDMEAIEQCFKFRPAGQADSRELRYISADSAGQGEDSTVIILWRHLWAEKIWRSRDMKTTEATALIREQMSLYNIPSSNIVIDIDGGYGLGIHESIPGSVGFKNNGVPIGRQNYRNLKTQCYYKLAELINTGKIYIKAEGPERDMITAELEQVKRDRVDNDGKLCIVGKAGMKVELQRSPDYADALMMRMWFTIDEHVMGKGNYDLYFMDDTGSVKTNDWHQDYKKFVERQSQTEHIPLHYGSEKPIKEFRIDMSNLKDGLERAEKGL